MLFPERERLHSVNVFYDVEGEEKLTDLIEVHFVELKKLKVESSAELKTPFERWLQALKFSRLYSSHPEAVPRGLQNEEGIEMAFKAMRETLASEEVQELILAREKAERDELSRLKAATQEGQAEGRAEGELRGHLDFVRGLTAAGFTPEKIAEVSGLPLDTVRGLVAMLG